MPVNAQEAATRIIDRSVLAKPGQRRSSVDFDSKLNEGKKRTSDWVQLVQTNRYQIPATELGKIHVEMNLLEDMQPMNLEVLIGQGPVPAGMKAYMERRNRSWLHRYQHFIYLLAVILVLWFLAVRFLRKRD